MFRSLNVFPYIVPLSGSVVMSFSISASDETISSAASSFAMTSVSFKSLAETAISEHERTNNIEKTSNSFLCFIIIFSIINNI